MRSARITAFMAAFHAAVLAISAAETPGRESPVAATVLATSITAADIGLQCDAANKPILPAKATETGPERNPLNELRTRVMREVSRAYVEEHHLQATAQEIQEFQDFQERFMAQDRLRRQRRLADLERNLQDPTLGAQEREQAEKNRATLLSLAAHDGRRDEKDRRREAEGSSEIARQWVEGWKLNTSIHATYGGTVAITAFGPQPVEATRRLLEEYEKQGKLVIHDEDLRRHFWDYLSQPPRFTAKPEELDFTPYWKKPPPEGGD